MPLNHHNCSTPQASYDGRRPCVQHGHSQGSSCHTGHTSNLSDKYDSSPQCHPAEDVAACPPLVGVDVHILPPLIITATTKLSRFGCAFGGQADIWVDGDTIIHGLLPPRVGNANTPPTAPSMLAVPSSAPLRVRLIGHSVRGTPTRRGLLPCPCRYDRMT